MATTLMIARNRLGGLCRQGGTPERIAVARAELNRAILDDRIATIAELVDALTDDQRARLAQLAA